ncbi:hypothetical protein MASR2M48_34190 [Spirochaetota bacterium]
MSTSQELKEIYQGIENEISGNAIAEKVAKIKGIVIDDLDEQYIIVLFGGKSLIYDIKDRRFLGEHREVRQIINDTVTLYSIRNGKLITEEKSSFDIWYAETKNRYFNLVFRPALAPGEVIQNGKKIWNTWNGWPYEPKDGDCDIYLDHIQQNICDNDMRLNHFVLNWMAHIIQYPEEKNFVALTIKGEQGTGKTMFLKLFMKLFGDYGVEINNIDQIAHHFNSLLQDKLFVYGDEAFWSGDVKIRGQLKNMISSMDMNLTLKGKDSVKYANYMRFAFTTNNPWGGPVEKGERRWLSIKCGDKRRNDSSYFVAMERQLENGGYNALMKYLLERDLNNCNWRLLVTDSMIEDLGFTMTRDNPILNFFEDTLAGGVTGSIIPFEMKTEGCLIVGTLIQELLRYVNANSIKWDVNSKSVGMKMKEIFGDDLISKPKKIRGNTVRVYDLDETRILEAIKGYAAKSLGTVVRKR